MSRATEDTLDQVHARTAEVMLTKLNDPDITAAELNAIVKFLKDNDITALPGSPRMAPLKEGMDALNDRDSNVVDFSQFRTR